MTVVGKESSMAAMLVSEWVLSMVDKLVRVKVGKKDFLQDYKMAALKGDRLVGC